MLDRIFVLKCILTSSGPRAYKRETVTSKSDSFNSMSRRIYCMSEGNEAESSDQVRPELPARYVFSIAVTSPT